MPKIEFDPKFSFGNVATLVVLGFGIAVAWGEKNADVAMLSKSDADHELSIHSADQAIRTLEKSQERILERLEGLKVTVERIEKKLP